MTKLPPSPLTPTQGLKSYFLQPNCHTRRGVVNIIQNKIMPYYKARVTNIIKNKNKTEWSIALDLKMGVKCCFQIESSNIKQPWIMSCDDS